MDGHVPGPVPGGHAEKRQLDWPKVILGVMFLMFVACLFAILVAFLVNQCLVLVSQDTGCRHNKCRRLADEEAGRAAAANLNDSARRLLAGEGQHLEDRAAVYGTFQAPEDVDRSRASENSLWVVRWPIPYRYEDMFPPQNPDNASR